jgi:hypothetical protein
MSNKASGAGGLTCQTAAIIGTALAAVLWCLAFYGPPDLPALLEWLGFRPHGR